MLKEESRSRIVLVRVRDDDFKRMSRAAKAKDQTLSDWIRGNLGIVTEG
jgi:uncharacterized protein (DUF1778 family)